jgi:hypothetical protein
MRRTLRGLMAAPTGPFSQYAPTAAGIKRLPAYTLQPSGNVSLRSGHRRLPNKNAPAAFLESREASAWTKVRTRSRSIAIRCKPSSVRTIPPKTSLDSQCPLAGIGRGTERGAWLDAPPFAAKPQVQGRLASGEEFGLSCEYAPAARAIKPNSLARTRSGRLAHSRSVYRERSVVGFAR